MVKRPSRNYELQVGTYGLGIAKEFELDEQDKEKNEPIINKNKYTPFIFKNIIKFNSKFNISFIILFIFLIHFYNQVKVL